MNVTKTFLVSAIGLVLTLVIIGIGVGVYRSVKPIADNASEGVNTLAGELTSEFYQYNGKVMTGEQIALDATLKDLKYVSGPTNGVYTIDCTKAVGTEPKLSSKVTATKSYTITLNWDSGTNTADTLTITELNK